MKFRRLKMGGLVDVALLVVFVRTITRPESSTPEVLSSPLIAGPFVTHPADSKRARRAASTIADLLLDRLSKRQVRARVAVPMGVDTTPRPLERHDVFLVRSSCRSFGSQRVRC